MNLFHWLLQAKTECIIHLIFLIWIKSDGIMKLVTVSEMKLIEREAFEHGMSYSTMMENAGAGIGSWIDSSYLSKGRAVGLIGPGNNGGDTLIALDYLSTHGWEICAVLIYPRKDGDPLIERLQKKKATVFQVSEDYDLKLLETNIIKASVLLDGIFGTGTHLPLQQEITQTLTKIKEMISSRKIPIQVIAVDCPSGVDCDNGETAPVCIPANTTLCLGAVKVGLLKFPAFSYAGEIEVIDIGFLDSLVSQTSIKRFLVSRQDVKKLLPERKIDSHKGTFGTLTVVAGSINYPGAALLTGKSAYRAGTGLVIMAVPEIIQEKIAGHLPEATWLLLSHEDGGISRSSASVLFQNLKRTTALLIGPGLGVAETTFGFIENLLKNNPTPAEGSFGFLLKKNEEGEARHPLPPMVIDADGLRLMARIPEWYSLISQTAILTPHPGEMSALCGLSIDEIQSDRIQIAEKFAKIWGHVVVLKGACTVISSPDGETAVIPIATPALARAGSGDVLAGIIAGLRAQGVKPFEAAFSGAWIHAQAGLVAASKLGNTASILASDIEQSISDVISSLVE